MDHKSSIQSASPKKILSAMRQLVVNVFSEALEDFRQHISMPAFRMDTDATELELKTRLAAVNAFNQAGQHVINKAITELSKQFGVPQNQDSLFDIDDDLLDSLSIVGDEEIEIDIALSRYIALAETEYRQTLLHLEVRLYELSSQTVRGVNPHSLHPGTLIDPFRNQIDALDVGVEGKIILCNEFCLKLVPMLGDLYSQCNALLAESAILSDPKTLADAIREKKSRDRLNYTDTGEHQLPLSERLESAPSALNEDEQPDQDETASEPAQIKTTTPLSTAKLSSNQVQALTQYLGGAKAAPSNPAVIDALNTLQRASVPDGKPLSAAQIRDSLLRHSQDPRITSTRRLPERENRTIEFVSEIFNAIFNDDSINDSMKVLSAKLQIPLIKVALTQIDFVRNEQHPARLLLNELLALNVHVPDRKTPLFNKLAGIITSVINNYSSDQRIFTTALRQIKQLSQSEMLDAQPIEEQVTARADILAQRAAAKRTVVSALNRHMHNKAMPSSAVDFIIKCWAPYMSLIYLRDGSDSDAWRQAIMSVKRIIEAAQPERTLAEINGIIGRSRSFVGELAAQLNQAGINSDEQQRLTESIDRWLDQLKHQKARQFDAQIADDQPIYDDMQVPEELLATSLDWLNNPIAAVTLELSKEDSIDPTAERINGWVNSLPETVQVNEWYLVYLEKTGHQVRAKLQAILRPTGKLLFSEHKATEGIEVDIPQFIEQLKDGRSKHISVQSRFESAMSNAADHLTAHQGVGA